MLVVDNIPGGHGHSHSEAVPMAESEKLIETYTPIEKYFSLSLMFLGASKK